MGLISKGHPLNWKDTKELAEHVKYHGIQQFINLYKKFHNRQDKNLKFGDELEYIIVKFDDERKTAKVSLRANELLAILNEKELANDRNGITSLWRPEYALFMIESSPARPYGELFASINKIEANMRHRRKEVQDLLSPDETIMTLSNFPRLGVSMFTYPPIIKSNQNELNFPNELINTCVPRFKTFTENIRHRRGQDININVPVYMDEKTKLPDEYATPHRLNSINLNATGFGLGCCCLQVTLQANNIDEAKYLYDQLIPLSPILLALSAASPIFAGYLVESDSRWNVISASCDCRTAEERGEKKLNGNQYLLKKSRYDSVDLYLSKDGEKYNDIPLVFDERHYQQLRTAGIDHLLAQHIAHLFIRDPVILLEEDINQNDEEHTDHFENIQSTNWQSLRFKPPPNASIGWRVEFRTCDIQLTDFENAAIVCFIMLWTRVILSYNLSLLIPISKVDENMQVAQKRNAYKNDQFWFRKNIFREDNFRTMHENSSDDMFTEYELMSTNQIINGSDSFPGIIPLIQNYLQSFDIDIKTHRTIQNYMNLISRRASGKLLTVAAWIRNEVLNHPEYKQDSVVSDRINYDLLKKIQKMQDVGMPCPLLLEQNDNKKKTDSFVSVLQNRLNLTKNNQHTF